jgi:predicted metalloendopeptidase
MAGATAVATGLAALAAGVPVTVAQEGTAPTLSQPASALARHGIDPADMDAAADPRQDFYRFANGGWLDRTEIPADEGQYGVFNELNDETIAFLLDLLDRLAAGGTLQGGTDEWKAVRLFEQGNDLATRNAEGIDPVRPVLAEIDAIADLTDYHRFLEGATFRGIDGLFPIFVVPELMDATTMGAFVSGPHLGLPNRDYYLEDDAGNKKIRAAYRATAAKLLTMTGYEPARAEAAAQAVYDLERRLAELTLSREEQQNAANFNNPTRVDQLAAIYPLMDWPRYLAAHGLSDVAEVNVDELRYLQALAGVVESTPIDALKDYLKLQVLWTFRLSLSAEVEETWFDLRGRLLAGIEELPPLEERSLYQVNALLGEAVGKLYVAEAFPPEAKAQITELAEAVKIAFGERLDANTWMTPETKAKAREKLDKLSLKVGYPDRWKSYGAVTIEGSYAASVLSATNAEKRRTLDQVGKPVDPGEWTLRGFGPVPPQTINAFYSPQDNEIVFPAAILQPPFFDYRADPASNFGAIGFLIGHEITHGFDLVGSQFDADGNLNNWWTPEDYERFRALNDRVVQQYNAIEVLPGLSIAGQITVTENVADMGGVQVAYDALRHYLATRGQPLPQAEASPVASSLADVVATPPGSAPASPVASPAAAVAELTQEQRFFVAAATIWREKIRDELLETLLKTDTHAPAEIRATQPIRNMDAFHEAFGTRPGDAMYLPPEERVVVW